MAQGGPLTRAAQSFFTQFNAGQERQRQLALAQQKQENQDRLFQLKQQGQEQELQLKRQEQQNTIDAAVLKRQQEIDDRENLALSIEGAIGIDTGGVATGDQPQDERRGGDRISDFVFNDKQRKAFSEAVANNPAVSAPILNFLSKSNDFQIQERSNQTSRRMRAWLFLQNQHKKSPVVFQEGIKQLVESGLFSESERNKLVELSNETNPDFVSLTLEKGIADTAPEKVLLEEEVAKRKEARAPAEEFTLSPGQRRFAGSEEIARVEEAPTATESRTVNIGGGRQQLQEFNTETKKFENVGIPFEEGVRGATELAQDVQIEKAKSQVEFQNAVALKKAELDLQEQTPTAKRKEKLDDLRIENIQNKRTLGIAKREMQLDARQVQIDVINGRIDSALAIVDNWFASGILAPTMNFLIPSNAREMEGLIDTIKANLSFETLSAMREASQSGGALGAINTRELQLLGSTIDSLDIGLPDKVLKRNLNRIKDTLKTWQARVQKERAALTRSQQGQATPNGRGVTNIPPVPDFSQMTTEELLEGF